MNFIDIEGVELEIEISFLIAETFDNEALFIIIFVIVLNKVFCSI